jgi:CheY-like chemotaxis protein/HPt (histidine-containing phosphotransfer) domain-containing protein
VARVLQVKANEKSLALSVRWETKIPQIVYTDAARVRQALMNVVGNAIKFTPAGSVEIVGRFVQAGERPQLQIDVVDTGIGIAPDKVSAIFDPFIQADTSVTRRFGGTGLGLAISRRIARGLGGDLTVESKPGHGSRFTLSFDVGNIDCLRLVAPADVIASSSASSAAGAPQKVLPSVNVLLVEDGDTNRKLIKLLLERAGAKVATAENGEIGCRMALDQPFDVILMDMQMPVLDGYSATRRLRDSGQIVPIIALTANAMSSDRQECLDAGCTDYLTKPINTEQLFASIGRAISLPERPGDEAAVPVADGAAVHVAEPPAELERDIASTLPTDDRELAEIIVEYVDSLGTKLDQMEQAWNDRRLEELARLAHWLKGSGGTAGFSVFNQPAARLESVARQRESGDIPALIQDLRALHQRLIIPSVE